MSKTSLAAPVPKAMLAEDEPPAAARTKQPTKKSNKTTALEKEIAKTAAALSRSSITENDNDNKDSDAIEETGMGVEATVRFLRAKLNVSLDRITELNQQVKENEVRLNAYDQHVQSLQDENSKLLKYQATLQAQLEKQKRSTDEERCRVETLESEVQSLRKELESMHRQKKQQDHENASREIRLNRALEELQKTKQQQALAQNKKDEVLNQSHQENTSLRTEVKRLEKQKQEMVVAFKKQMQLIDVLKRQKMHLEAVHLLRFTEEEFMKCLDWKAE
jgi:chromosome segregation ATPase